MLSLRFIPNSGPQGVFEFVLRTTGLSDFFFFRECKLSIRLWLLKANLGLQPQIRFLFFPPTSYIASAISMSSFLPRLSCCSCSAPCFSMSSKPMAFPVPSQGALLCVQFWFPLQSPPYPLDAMPWPELEPWNYAVPAPASAAGFPGGLWNIFLYSLYSGFTPLLSLTCIWDCCHVF